MLSTRTLLDTVDNDYHGTCDFVGDKCEQEPYSVWPMCVRSSNLTLLYRTRLNKVIQRSYL